MATAPEQTQHTRGDRSEVGRWMRRADGAAKVTGHARYTGDLSMPGMLHAALVLSPYPHARIVSIQTAAAVALPGVAAVITAETLPLHVPDEATRARLPLARGETLFDGQPVAVVLAESAALAEDGAGLVVVSYEGLPAAVDVETTLVSAHPLVHGTEAVGVRSDAGAHGDTGAADGVTGPANAAATERIVRGEVAVGFQEAAVVVERTYRTAWVHQSYLEPQSCLAVPDGVGGITLYSSTQGAFNTRREVAAALGIALRRVNVVPMELGGGFGAKYTLIDPLVAGLAWAIKRPVRLIYTRSEELRAANPAPATVIRVKTGARRDGLLTALEATIMIDTGAYPCGQLGLLVTQLAGLYRIPHLLIEGHEVFTHKPGAGAYRAPCAPQACFAIEGQIEELARQLALDPLELRLRNAVVEGDPLPSGRLWPTMGSRAVLEALRAHPAWKGRATRRPGEGVGLAFSGLPGSTEPSSAVCHLNDDGSLTVVTGMADLTGASTGLALLAAEALGVAAEAVNVVTADTNTASYAPATGGSKNTYTLGAAVAQAAADVRAQVCALAADYLEAAPDDLEIVGGRVEVRGAPGRGVSLTEVARLGMESGAHGGPIVGHGRAAPSAAAPSFLAHLARVQVDGETGAVRVLDYVAVHDVGRIINPGGIDEQICGGVAQGIGWALGETLAYDRDGRVQAGSLLDYALPSVGAVPPITPVLVEIPSAEGPLGARGIGEPPIIGGAAAIANAILDAVGVRPSVLPMTSERVLEAIRQRDVEL